MGELLFIECLASPPVATSCDTTAVASGHIHYPLQVAAVVAQEFATPRKSIAALHLLCTIRNSSF